LIRNKETEKTLKGQQLIWLLLLLFSLIFFTRQGCAGSWQNAFSSRISAEYESNPAMIPADRVGVRRFLFEPSYTLMGQVGANELNAGLSLLISRSSNIILSPNREDPNVYFNWSHKSDTDEINISPRYSEIATSNAGIDATRPVPVSSTRASRSLSGRWIKELSERSSFSADGNFESVTYRGAGNYVDYSTSTGSLRLNHDVSEISTLFLSVLEQNYVPIGSTTSSRHAVGTIGLDRKALYMDWSMHLGRYMGGGVTGTEGGASVHYTGLNSQLALNANRQITSSGLGGYVVVEQLVGNWSYALSERNNIGIDLQWWKNLSTTFYNIRTNTGIWLQHIFSPSWMGRMHYQNNILTGGGVVSASSNIIGISLVYTNSDF
jgi:hypothetical protein